jgi:hypothetical protein
MASKRLNRVIANNPVDCIDYQIESDFAGLSPGMPNTASAISDKIDIL